MSIMEHQDRIDYLVGKAKEAAAKLNLEPATLAIAEEQLVKSMTEAAYTWLCEVEELEEMLAGEDW